jgi:hypothetical protein
MEKYSERHEMEREIPEKMDKHKSKKMMPHEEHMAHSVTVGERMGGKYSTPEAAAKMTSVMEKHDAMHHCESRPISKETNDLSSGLKGMPTESTRGMNEMYGKLSKV